MENLITFLNSQESNIRTFSAIHIGFFESNKGISFYVTGAPKGEVGSDEHCSYEIFPLNPDRYLIVKSDVVEPFAFVQQIKKQIETALTENKLADSFKKAEILTLGWDDGDLEYIK